MWLRRIASGGLVNTVTNLRVLKTAGILDHINDYKVQKKLCSMKSVNESCQIVIFTVALYRSRGSSVSIVSGY
jgi:hypothetical protein